MRGLVSWDIGNKSDESPHGENKTMSDPYTEATRHERRGLPTFAKVVLVAGGLFAATLVAVAVVGAVFARKAVLEADLETMEFETTTTEIGRASCRERV